ncbi:hypothetical protein, partial [Runella sp.]|uniref:hypothetical protein n=1 Tax=Runella sp. TaxID=1960881 RepID=UPI00301A3AD9
MTTKILFITLLIFSLGTSLFAQNPNIYLGKRKNIVWDRKIDYRNLGSIYTYYYPVYYKTNTQSYRKAGMFGGRLAPYMATDPEAWTEFKKF